MIVLRIKRQGAGLELLGIAVLIAILFIPIGIYRLERYLVAGMNQHITAMQSIDQRLARIESTLAAGQEPQERGAR